MAAAASAERARERDVNRYYQTWLESASGYTAIHNETAPAQFHPDGSALRASNDKALIAFAQLGCLRLNAKRGIVTLIGSIRQYIIAEATKSLSLISDLTDDGEQDELWFGNASIPRSQGISEAALKAPSYTAVGRTGRTHTAPALVINDITKDERYKDNAFAGNGIFFYCGVPITSKAGHIIGVYTITDDKPRDGITLQELVFMQDMAKIVMRHLETVKNEAARSRGERMVLGLGNFMRGKSSIHDEPHPETTLAFGETKPSDRDSVIDEVEMTKSFKGMNVTNADPDILRQKLISTNSLRPGMPSRSSGQLSSATTNELPDPEKTSVIEDRQFGGTKDGRPAEASSRTISSEEKPVETLGSLRPTKTQNVFSRAANILRECIEADGVVFFDAVSTNLARRSGTAEFTPYPESSAENSTGTSDEGQSGSEDWSSSGPSTESDGSTHDSSRSRMLSAKGKKCEMLGYALCISAQSTANSNTIGTLGLTERSLRHFIRRYPKGKAFYYTADGELSASESEESDHSRQNGSGLTAMDQAIWRPTKRNSSKAIADELIRVVPGARNVIWLPLWDFSKQRWSAGIFAWSRNPDRLLATQDDLVYLRTFGNSIMIETSRIDAQSADEAKATFIANISHELRSPLHGILGSVEFLQETALDAFQSSMALGVETCAKSLHDTVEHVLDYAKINQMSSKFAKKGRPQRLSAADDKPSRSALEDDVELAALFEEAVEAVYAGQTFRTQDSNRKPDSPIAEAQSSQEESKERTIANVQRASNKFSGAVRVVLKIEKQDNWWMHTQPGAIRRVIMNILGNALKYTDRGTVLVSLAATEDGPRTPSKRSICIRVKDTGRGISKNFLQNHAFTPFRQESSFSVGTGLGLSIVRQIVDSLGGRIDLQSVKNSGTEVKVYLSLPLLKKPPSASSTSSILSSVQQKTPGMSLCVLDPNLEGYKSEGDLSRDSVEKSLRELAESWFGMRTMRAQSMDDVHTDFFVYAEPPPIEYLLKHHGQHSRTTEVPVIVMATNAFECASLAANGINRLTGVGRVLEIVSQPCGPQKLAKALHRCLARLDSLAKRPDDFSTSEAVTPAVSDNPETELGRNGTRTSVSYMDEPETPQERAERKISNIQPPPLVGQQEASSGDSQTESEANHSPAPVRGTLTREQSYSTTMTDSARSEPDTSTKDNPPVLLVDDNDINLNLLVAFMKKAKHPYETVKDGRQAVEAYERASTDRRTAFKYVLMDISMPVMDGITATRKIRRFEKKSEMKDRAIIVALTGLAAESTQEEMFDAGADYYQAKPVKFKELMELFRTSDKETA